MNRDGEGSFVPVANGDDELSHFSGRARKGYTPSSAVTEGVG